ncbi:MAG: class I SAM-dependent rRNA methyltransferase [Deltaproteobacteria bacterium]|nr:class I SAM-dependent rRNA methyltransferase [Deltaproteobacteria bacterium]
MFLKGAIRLKKSSRKFSAKILSAGLPWVYSNEIERIDASLSPGAWVALEAAAGQALGYGHFNPHSLIAYREFERAPFRSEEQSRALFFTRLDRALEMRMRAFGERIASGGMGGRSFRLVFGESDGVPGLVVDLYESVSGRAAAVAQCHSAGADGFVFWLQQWLAERMGVDSGVLRNDLDARRRENAPLSVSEWGSLPSEPFALEGGVRFFVDLKQGQKTGYFYDLRDCRAELSARAASLEAPAVLDCFSYVGAWGLQVLRKNPRATLVALDVSGAALQSLRRNAEANDLGARVETVQADFFKLGDRPFVPKDGFDVVAVDPPALTVSAKQAAQGRRAHEACFAEGLGMLRAGGLAAFSSCSFHLSWGDFMECVARASHARSGGLRISYFGSQSADHPVLASMPESRYLKCVIGNTLFR